MEFQIVVARYNEDINWLNDYKDYCVIYNKGKFINCKNEITLPNRGRESHTYLWHIINNYDKLAEITIFTQARIADHRGFNHDNVNHLINLKNEAQCNGKSTPEEYFHHHDNHYNCSQPDWNLCNGEFYLKDNYINNQHILFIDWFKNHILPEYPNPIKIYWNGIFAVKKEIILKKPKSYYQNLINQLFYHINPVEGHFFERSWYYIFD